MLLLNYTKPSKELNPLIIKNSDIIIFDLFNEAIQKMREYKYVSTEDRYALLHLINVCSVSIKNASEKLSIKYDAAKAIYRKD